MLNRETKFGLTFGQMIAVFGIIGGILTAWIDLNIKVTALDEKSKYTEQRVDRIESASEIVRQENRQDHQRMEAKMDMLIEKLTDKN